MLSSLGEVTLLAVEVSVVLLGPCIRRVTYENGENGILVDRGWNVSRWKARKRTDDHRNDPIANLGREASVSIEQITPEKILGSALPERRDSCETPRS